MKSYAEAMQATQDVKKKEAELKTLSQGLGFGFRVWGLGLGFRDSGLGFRVEDLGFRVEGLGFGFRVQY